MSEALAGWGRTAPTLATVHRTDAAGVSAAVRSAGARGVLARGLGRSYGDAAQNAGGGVIRLPGSEPVMVGPDRGWADVGAGTSLHDLMRVLLPQGLFLAVTPGTREVTVGGSIACDVHGKNQHRTGSFGDHVIHLDLVDADGNVRRIGPDRDPELFWATVGGMGLTGIIIAARIRLRSVDSAWMTVHTSRQPDLDAAMTALREADDRSPYSVSWIDLLARGGSLGRSVLTHGDHASTAALSGPARREPLRVPTRARIGVPLTAPAWLLSRPTVTAFNEMWWRRAPTREQTGLESIADFFHPLDAVGDWNRLYGRRGFVQYQCVVPDGQEEALRSLVVRIATSGRASFLAVLKRFGKENPGWLSFPMPGWTLAVDLPVEPGLGGMLDDLDGRVVAAGGRVYLAKDSRLRPEVVREMYPRIHDLAALRRRTGADRVFTSDLARRLALDGGPENDRSTR